MFRRLVIVSSIAVMLVGTVAMAQGFRGRPGFRGDFSSRLKERLNLTDAQVNGIQALKENRRKDMQSLRQEMQPKRQALRQLLNQPSPNPTDVGNATLALKQTRERARDINQRFISGVKGLLTPDQLQKLPKRFQ
jgi:Spy/CpxP family protein refolding chaperone